MNITNYMNYNNMINCNNNTMINKIILLAI